MISTLNWDYDITCENILATNLKVPIVPTVSKVV